MFPWDLGPFVQTEPLTTDRREWGDACNRSTGEKGKRYEVLYRCLCKKKKNSSGEDY